MGPRRWVQGADGWNEIHPRSLFGQGGNRKGQGKGDEKGGGKGKAKGKAEGKQGYKGKGAVAESGNPYKGKGKGLGQWGGKDSAKGSAKGSNAHGHFGHFGHHGKGSGVDRPIKAICGSCNFEVLDSKLFRRCPDCGEEYKPEDKEDPEAKDKKQGGETNAFRKDPEFLAWLKGRSGETQEAAKALEPKEPAPAASKSTSDPEKDLQAAMSALKVLRHEVSQQSTSVATAESRLAQAKAKRQEAINKLQKKEVEAKELAVKANLAAPIDVPVGNGNGVAINPTQLVATFTQRLESSLQAESATLAGEVQTRLAQAIETIRALDAAFINSSLADVLSPTAQQVPLPGATAAAQPAATAPVPGGSSGAPNDRGRRAVQAEGGSSRANNSSRSRSRERRQREEREEKERRQQNGDGEEPLVDAAMADLLERDGKSVREEDEDEAQRIAKRAKMLEEEGIEQAKKAAEAEAIKKSSG